MANSKPVKHESQEDQVRPGIEIPSKSFPKNREVYWLAGGIMVVLLVIVAYKFNQQPVVFPQHSPLTSPVTQTSPTTNTDSMKNWKTYTNEKYKYSIKYPSNLEPQVSAPGIGIVTANAFAQTLTIGSTSISAFEYQPESYVLQEWKKSEITINGFSGTKYVKEKENKENIDSSISLLPVGSVTYIFKHPSEDFYLQITTKNNQILSSFKFADSNSSKPGWKNYDDPKGKYSISVPIEWQILPAPTEGWGGVLTLTLANKAKIEIGKLEKNQSTGNSPKEVFLNPNNYLNHGGEYTEIKNNVNEFRAVIPLLEDTPPGYKAIFSLLKGSDAYYFAELLSFDGKVEKFLDQYDQILSTLKFTK